MICWLVANTTLGMVQQGLSIPPPLRRGGGQRISTGLSVPPTGRAANYPVYAPKDSPKPRQVRRKKLASEGTDSDGYGSDSEPEGNIPWKNIAAILGPTITGSAVIQHLAKLRIPGCHLVILTRPRSTALALLLADTKVRGRKLVVVWSANV